MIIMPLSSLGGVDKERNEVERLHLTKIKTRATIGRSCFCEVLGGFEPP